MTKMAEQTARILAKKNLINGDEKHLASVAQTLDDVLRLRDIYDVLSQMTGAEVLEKIGSVEAKRFGTF